MFVRRTQTRTTANGERYFSHRLVCSERIGSRVRQRTRSISVATSSSRKPAGPPSVGASISS